VRNGRPGWKQVNVANKIAKIGNLPP